jgi:hypothetical protein
VVRALQPAQASLIVVDEARAAVPAGVQKGSREAVVVADDEHALAAGVDVDVPPTLRHLFSMTCANPAASEEVGAFPFIDGLVCERRSGELRRPLQRQARALEIRGVERESGIRHRHRDSFLRG